MIKRLTDEPAPLAVARPDLTFPPGLQQTFDTAFARMPAERYQQVAKYAADVAAVTGRARAPTSAVPPTRAVDTEARTQVLGAAEAKAAPVAATRTSMGARRAPPRKRSPVPLIVGAVVVVGGGVGAWLFLNSPDGGPAGPDTTTSTSGALPAPSNQGGIATPGDTQRFVTQGGTTTPLGGRTETETSTPAGGGERRTAPPRSVDPAGAFAALDSLFEGLDSRILQPTVVRDSALRIYNGPGVSEKDRGFAAYVAANAYAALDDRATALEWARKAVTHDPASRAYPALVQSLSGP
jgi:hypothetical protein